MTNDKKKTGHDMEHVISYAYPTSESAVHFGFGKEGCYVLTVGKTACGFDSKEKALNEAEQLGTKAGRWSIDHPFNAALNARS